MRWPEMFYFYSAIIHRTRLQHFLQRGSVEKVSETQATIILFNILCLSAI